MNKLDLVECINEINAYKYCIVKPSIDFPMYVSGQDVDIFCYNIQDVAKKILAVLRRYVSAGYTIRLTDKKQQIYIDILVDKKIEFRFDLYGSLPQYQNVSIKDSFFESVIENAICIKTTINSTGLTYFIPMPLDDLILRYIEYQEWYSQRPDKIKHVDYINNYLSLDPHEYKTLFDRLHRYISLPEVWEDRSIAKYSFLRNGSYILSIFGKACQIYKKEGVLKMLARIRKKVLR